MMNQKRNHIIVQTGLIKQVQIVRELISLRNEFFNSILKNLVEHPIENALQTKKVHEKSPTVKEIVIVNLVLIYKELMIIDLELLYQYRSQEANQKEHLIIKNPWSKAVIIRLKQLSESFPMIPKKISKKKK